MSSYIIRSDTKVTKTEHEDISSFLLDKLKESYEQIILIDCESSRQWTGEQVYESALNLAYYLITECLLKPDDIVCFVAPDSGILAISILGVMAAGGVYCSLPSLSTYREIDEALTRIEPSFLVTDGHNYGIGATIATEMLSIKKLFLMDEKSGSDLTSGLDIFENILQYERSFLPLPISRNPDDICALLVVSASDGSTKAVIRTNRNLIFTSNALQNKESNERIDNDFMLITGLYSGSGLNMFLHAISSGSTVAIFNNNGSNDIFLDYMKEYRITSALLTTSQLSLYIENKDLITDLTVVWFFGTTLVDQIYKKAIHLFKKFIKISSASETGWVTHVEYLHGLDNKHNYKTIGRPVAGVEIKVVDSNAQSVPFNTVGEVCVRSHQCAPGYLNNEMESQQIQMSDGFIRSGDYGYYDSDGLFYVVGHSEEFIKVDDFLISAEELESILSAHMDVKEAAVIWIEDQRGEEYPKGLVSLKKNHNKEVTEQSLIDFVNLRVDRRKRLRSDGMEILNEGPHPQIRKLSLRRDLESHV